MILVIDYWWIKVFPLQEQIHRISRAQTGRRQNSEVKLVSVWRVGRTRTRTRSVCVAMASTDKRAKPTVSHSMIKAFITTVTSVKTLIYHRSNADISRRRCRFRMKKIFLKYNPRKNLHKMRLLNYTVEQLKLCRM